jgi:hypothetical protein
MAWPGSAGQLPAYFADRCCYYRVYYTSLGRIDGIQTEPYGCLAGNSTGAVNPGWYGIVIVVCDNDFIGIISADFFVLMSAPEWFDFSFVGGVAKPFIHAEDNKFCGSAYGWFSEGFYDNLGADASWVAHGYAYYRLLVYRIIRFRISHTLLLYRV